MKAPPRTVGISVIGLSGSGKSTCAAIIADLARERGLSCATVKLAEPLYSLQNHVYRAAGVPLAHGAQDQVLLEQLADSLRRIRPSSIADDFVERLARVNADIVINDDLRDPFIDQPTLRKHGFRILRVSCCEATRLKRLARRGDITNSEASTQALDLITPDAVVHNDWGLHDYRDAVRHIVGSWL